MRAITTYTKRSTLAWATGPWSVDDVHPHLLSLSLSLSLTNQVSLSLPISLSLSLYNKTPPREKKKKKEKHQTSAPLPSSLFTSFFHSFMRKSCPNLDREDGLETVLEVPIPEEVFTSTTKNGVRSWRNMISWMRSHSDKPTLSYFQGRSSELQILLGVVGAPLVPLPVSSDHSINGSINHLPRESSTAKYIVQQYIAAAGGDRILHGIDNMVAVGKVKMSVSEFPSGETTTTTYNKKSNKCKPRHGDEEVGSFVLWQKRPDLWCLELVLSGCKIGAGSDGKVAWRQTPWHHAHASRGPPRPLRRAMQGLDPRSTASLFSNSVCLGEKMINNEDCFVLKLEAEPSTLRARSNSKVEIIRHTIWGYFSQRTGLLVKLDDSHLLRIKTAGDDSMFWETTMESVIQDYRIVDGISIAHGGKTSVSLFSFGETTATDNYSRTRMEEEWTIEELDFNIQGLSMDCFLPPSDLKKEQEGCSPVTRSRRPAFRHQVSSIKMSSSKVAAIDVEESDSTDEYDDDEEFK